MAGIQHCWWQRPRDTPHSGLYCWRWVREEEEWEEEKGEGKEEKEAEEGEEREGKEEEGGRGWKKWGGKG